MASYPQDITPPEIRPVENGGLEVITTHINADFDAVASMIAAGKLYPDAVMVFPGSQERNLRNFFVQSMIYLFNVARVRDVEMDRVRRLILVDTRSADRIGPLERILENENLAIHIYDHHPDAPDDLKGELEMLAPVGSNATLMTEILAAKGVELSPEEATVLALGIYEDTGAFTFNSTTPRDYLAAAHLLAAGADLNVVAELTSRELTTEQVTLLSEMINAAQRHTINQVEVVVTQASTENYVDEVAVLVHKMMEMQSIQVLFALFNMEGRVHMVARSRTGQVNVGEIARHFGGGGHPSAAAATIRNMPLTQAADRLLALLAAAIGPVRTARDIMVFPVKSIGLDGNLYEARELLVRYNVNTLLVEDEAGLVKGYITRQNVAKALHHGLTDYPLIEFAATEFGWVGPEATFAEIQDVIVEQKQPVLPVLENGKAVGVITRTDLLNILTSETDVPQSVAGKDGSGRSRTKQINSLMRERLPVPLMDLLADIGATADSLGFTAYAVGGFVRDILLRQENLDVDVVIEGDAIAFSEVFASGRPGVRVRQHRKFNTAVLIFPGGFKLDVTTARLEYYEHPGALPVVEKGSLRLDLYRRDFTINTLAVSLAPKHFGTVIDYFQGLKDLKEGYIRVLHNLSFVEDPTRVFRAIRFEQRFGFRIGKLTATLIQNAVSHDVFHKLSGKRLLGEIRLILREEDPWPAVARLGEFDLYRFIHPKLDPGPSHVKLFRRTKKVKSWFDLTFLDEEYEPWLLYFLSLLVDLSQDEMVETARRLIPTKRERRIMIEEKPQAFRVMRWLSQANGIKPSDIHRELSQLSTESILFMMARTGREETTRAVSDYFTKYRKTKPDLTGRDLEAMGLKPGPLFREILDALLAGRLNGELASRSDEERFVRERFLGKKYGETG